MNSQNITIVGAGYVGYSLALMLSLDNKVTLLEIDDQKISLINKNKKILEDDYISEFLKDKKLNIKATNNAKEAFAFARYIIIAVPTSYDKNKQSFDTSILDSVINRAIAENSDAIIIIKSTVSIGYCQEISQFFDTDKIVYSPEFLREGSALRDNLYPSRLVLGTKNKKLLEDYIDIINSATLSRHFPILLTGYNEAESIKLFSNAYLANRVSFFNELDSFCMSKNMNVKDVINGICFDKRIGDFYNNPSFGYGGYCLPKDTKQLVSDFRNIPQKIFSAIIDSNITRAEFISEDIINKGIKKCGIYRLVMKKNSDNFRDSAIIRIIDCLKNSGIRISIFEPMIDKKEFCGCSIETDIDKFKNDNNIIIANRISSEIKDVEAKVYTRDVFNVD